MLKLCWNWFWTFRGRQLRTFFEIIAHLYLYLFFWEDRKDLGYSFQRIYNIIWSMDALWRSRDAIRVKIWNWDQPTDPLCVCTQGRFWRFLSIWKEKYHIEGWFSDESKIAWLSKIELSIFKDSSPLKVSPLDQNRTHSVLLPIWKKVIWDGGGTAWF